VTELTGTPVHFWFDPTCAFTWATSRWLTEVATQLGLEIRWQVMSLAILAEAQSVPDHSDDELETSWRPVRMLAAADAGHGAAATGRLYTALGEALHGRQCTVTDELLSAALASAELPAALLDAAANTSWDEAVRASHKDGQQRVGMDSGSPIIAIADGPGFFGPVVAPVPSGQAALDVWDVLVTASRVPAFSELKRARGKLTPPQ
jgi:2-hydroxychromene-2-carboxylate isomerase